MKMTVLDMVQDKKVPKSTRWARENKEVVAARDASRRKTLTGKLPYSVTNSKYRAKQKGMEHDLTTAFLKSLFEKQQGRCALTGNVMSITGVPLSEDEWMSISIDRIDNTRGYTVDNVQLVCTGVNRIKGQMTMEQLLLFCKQIVSYSEDVHG